MTEHHFVVKLVCYLRSASPPKKKQKNTEIWLYTL